MLSVYFRKLYKQVNFFQFFFYLPDLKENQQFASFNAFILILVLSSSFLASLTSSTYTIF